MGVSPNHGRPICLTCGNNELKCPGHMGRINLQTPIMHPKCTKIIVKLLKCICINCSRALIPKDKFGLIHENVEEKGERRFDFYVNSTKLGCNHCDGLKYKISKNKNQSMIKVEYDSSIPDKYLYPKDIIKIFEQISNEDLELIGFNQYLINDKKYSETPMLEYGLKHRHQVRPEWMIFTILPVLPPCARPVSVRDGVNNDDDLTDKYISIVKYNEKLKELNLGKSVKSKGKTKKDIEKEKEKYSRELEENIKTLFDNSKETSRINGGRPHKGLKERITSKDGHIRNNIQGKRCNSTARTVIDSGPFLETDQLGVPEEIANILTKPKIVSQLNIKELRELVKQGKIKTMRRKGERDITRVTKDTKINLYDSVDVNLQNGDWVLFNRQPTLRIESMMAFRVVIVKNKSFLLNLAVTGPFNADFDGDRQ